MKKDSNVFFGISQQEALSLLEKYGFNEFKGQDKRGLLGIIISAIREPMVLLLIGIGLIYLFLGEAEETYSLLTFLILILGITIYQDQKTEKTLEALKELSSPRAVVIREGKQIRIPGREIVPGDLVILAEGDRIPADTTLLKGGPLSIDESIITGESYPVEKSTSRDTTLLSGTLVLRGQALGKVTATGEHSELGKLGVALKEKSEETPLQKASKNIVKKLSLLVGVITVFVIFYYGISQNDLLSGVLVGLTLAMAILPNELPAVLLIFLAAGAWRIAKRNVLTRKVPAIEALGGITYLCVDKTGTLTQNKMLLRKLWNGNDTLDVTSFKDELPEPFHVLLEFGILATPRNPFDPMERALHETGDQFLQKTEHLHPDWKISKEYQITNELLAVSYAWKEEVESQFIIGAKGATEAIIDLCHLPAQRVKDVETEMISLAKDGLRVLAVARAAATSLPEKQHDLAFDFLGLIGFEDPIRSDVPGAVKECKEAGIKVLMMTGDHPETARTIAEQIGFENISETLSGKDVEAIDELELLEKLKKVQIFCRMKPQDKLRIVSVLQRANEIVAMTGDGVNDAPALKRAHIGVSMGKRGTDVAREASAIVLLDDNFSSIVAAIRTGRRIFQNLQDAFAYLLAIHLPITVLSIVPVLFKLPLILLPVHIAFLHLIIEPASTILFESHQDPGIMKQPPTMKTNHLLSKESIAKSLISGIVISIAVVGVYAYTLVRGLKAEDARGITFTALILLNLTLIIIMSRNRHGNKDKNYTRILVVTTLSLLCFVLYVPFFRELFRFEIMHIHDLILVVVSAGIAAVFMVPIYQDKKLPCDRVLS